MIKIIAGKHKNKSIQTPRNFNTRPTSSRLRETIFNILRHSNYLNLKFKEIRVLDLFSGSGAFGLECLSRGCKNCIFIDNSYESVNIIKNNIKYLHEENNSKVIKHDAIKPIKDTFNIDLCFLDPPYKFDKIQNIINDWASSGCINKEAIYILEKKYDISTIFPNNFKILDTRKQGISEIIFFNVLSSSK